MCATWPRKWESPKRTKTACRVREAFQRCFAKHGAVPKGETSTRGTGGVKEQLVRRIRMSSKSFI